jgi:hypothetical protein
MRPDTAPIAHIAGGENNVADFRLAGIDEDEKKASVDEKGGVGQADVQEVPEDASSEADSDEQEKLNIFEPFPVDPSAPVEEQQFTARAVITGCCLGERRCSIYRPIAHTCLGGLIAASNMYLGLKTGYVCAPLQGGVLLKSIDGPLARLSSVPYLVCSSSRPTLRRLIVCRLRYT